MTDTPSNEPALTPPLVLGADAASTAARSAALERDCDAITVTYDSRGNYQFRISHALDPADALSLLLNVCRDLSHFCARHPVPSNERAGLGSEASPTASPPTESD